MKRITKLSDQQLCTIVCRYQESDNLNDLLPVVDALHGLIYSIARQRPERGAIQLEDLIQEGILGVFKAAKEFQPLTSDSFTSFARNHICNAIRAFYTANCLPFSRPERSTTQLAVESIDSYMYDTMDCEGVQHAPILPAQLVSLFPENDSMQRCYLLQSALDTLSPLERQVIELSFSYAPMDDYVIAQHLNLTPPRLRQLRNSSIRKLRIKVGSINENEAIV